MDWGLLFLVFMHKSNAKNIIIVGGRGGMGQLCSKHLKSVGHSVMAIGRADWQENCHKLKDADLVIISVPIDATADTIKKVAKQIGSQTILSDITSIKQQPVQQMCKAHTGAVIGLHPVFGPSITDPHNQVIVHCPGRHHTKSQWIIDAFECAGFTMVEMEAKIHDQFMTIIQALKHFSAYCLGTFLHKEGIDLKTTRKIASPIYRLEMDMMGRIFSQSPELYADIIMADEDRLKMIRSFVNHIDDACSDIEAKKRDEFINKFKDTATWMGDFTKTAMEESDRVLKVIDSEK